jgi:hypothetical protein
LAQFLAIYLKRIIVKSLILSFLLSFIFSLSLQGRIWYISQFAEGDGSSWTSATSDLTDILTKVEYGDQIWVSAGIYYPTNNANREAYFLIPDGISLYGGFSGIEKSIQERDLLNFKTILSGEIGTPVSEDNSYTVVMTIGVSSATTIDGFVITGGYANGHGLPGSIHRAGGGWYNDGSKGESSPTILNCIFEGNFAREGGAFYNNGEEGRANPYIRNSAFVFNKADLDGGAIFNHGKNGESSPIILDSYFTENEATYGAGILNQGAFGVVKPLVSNCTFKGNNSIIRGSSIYSYNQEFSDCAPIVQACIFDDNKSGIPAPAVTGNINDLLFQSFSRPAQDKPTFFVRSTAN